MSIGLALGTRIGGAGSVGVKENPFLFLAPLSGSLQFFERADPTYGSGVSQVGTLAQSGAVRWQPGLDPSLESPTLLIAFTGSGADLTDRAGVAAPTVSGPLRYQP